MLKYHTQNYCKSSKISVHSGRNTCSLEVHMSHSPCTVFVQITQSQDIPDHPTWNETNSLATIYTPASPNLWEFYFLRHTSSSETPHSLFIDMISCLFHQSNVSAIRTRIFFFSYHNISFSCHILTARINIWHVMESKNNSWICYRFMNLESKIFTTTTLYWKL